MTEFDKTPIIDLFVSIQGEGSLSGIRTIFIRTSGCNLRCKFKNSICDTAYSSYNPEKGKFTLEQIVDFIKRDSATHICLTGGEPCLYPDFIKWVKMTFPTHHLTVETNGTIPIDEKTAALIDLASISPKMLSSVDPEDSERERRELWIKHSSAPIVKLLQNAKQSQLKYVVADEDDLKEIEEHIHEIEERLGNNTYLNKDVIYLMAACSCTKDMLTYSTVAGDLAMKYGYSFSPRLQYLCWGEKREA